MRFAGCSSRRQSARGRCEAVSWASIGHSRGRPRPGRSCRACRANISGVRFFRARCRYARRRPPSSLERSSLQPPQRLPNTRISGRGATSGSCTSSAMPCWRPACTCRVARTPTAPSDLSIPIREQPGTKAAVRIGEGAWIGSAAIVLADVGHGTIVGAGAVVTRPLPGLVVAGGVPARIINHRSDRHHRDAAIAG